MSESKINQTVLSTNPSPTDSNISHMATKNDQKKNAKQSASSMTQDHLLSTQESRETTAEINQFKDNVEGGLRFVHQMEVQGRIEQTQLAIEASALADLLIAKGIISAREFDERKQQAAIEQEKRDALKAFPILGDVADKYQVETPQIPCAELLHLCRAACCNLSFSLAMQDLDEGIIQWNYTIPYAIRNDPLTGKCIHFLNGQGCGVYSNRPAVCRSYDCRTDKRIWIDFEKRLPANDLENLAPVPVLPFKSNRSEIQNNVVPQGLKEDQSI